MKKVILVLLAFQVILLASCSSEVNNVEPQEDIFFQADAGMRVWHDNGGDDFGCDGSGGTCLDDVIIIGDRIDLKKSGESAPIAAMLKNPNAHIKSFASSLPEKLAKGVDNGLLSVEFKSKPTDANQTYMIMKQNGKVIAVAPFKSKKTTESGSAKTE